jgi:Zn-dependent protease with chaperone function
MAMPMSAAQFDSLVQRIEDDARENPSRYRRNVIGLALLGYGYLALLLALLAAALVAAVLSVYVLKALAIKLFIAIGAFVAVIVRALWVRIPEPEGLVLDRDAGTPLFERIESIRSALGAPPFHRVLITDDFNAAVVQVPRLGLFGWHRNFLLLGLPLLKTLTPAQFEAVLAHEFGHLAGGHARVGNWIYRLRAGWARLHDAMIGQQHWGSLAVQPFFNWYAPWFAAYSFPLARMNEYEADAVAARIASPRAMAEALTGVDVIGAWLGERFWPDLHKRVRDTPRPAFSPFATLGDGLADAIQGDAAHEWLARAMSRRTSSADTHPALADRLRALGETPCIAPPVSQSAAQALLGPQLPLLESQLDARWSERVAGDWEREHREREHREYTQAAARLAELDRRVNHGGETLPLEEALERARLTETLAADPESSLAQLDAIAGAAPEHALVQFLLGRLRLTRDSAAALSHFERAIAIDPEAELSVCQIVCEHFTLHGPPDAAQRWSERWERAGSAWSAARAEREALHLRDRFDPHGLSAARASALATDLAAIGVRRAWLVRKRLQHRPESPLYVLGFKLTPWWKLRNARAIDALMQRIVGSIELPGETLVINVEGDNYRFGRKFYWMRGTRLRARKG